MEQPLYLSAWFLSTVQQRSTGSGGGRNLPEKNWVMSASVEEKGRPLSRTTLLVDRVWMDVFKMSSASLFVTSYTVNTKSTT